ncbi:hypothetical protein [Mesobacillus subterraneus]|uniref:Uncharacterized protein n=1 Tax=Mesobacillus subterraneus TaxID=285983 RepID=A0A427TUA4_9BACI|nr:hypothetical protein [Mesobacillus subterraneus]RSD27808.1 hypothetical protein EJA10_08515 [Mesobacillus subterraneus]
MKNPMLISLYLVCSIFMLLGNPVYSRASYPNKDDYLFPANTKIFIGETVDEFYQALRDRRYPVHQEFYKRHKQRQKDLDAGLFKEIPDASINFRKKVFFYEVKRFNYMIWDGNVLHSYPDIDLKYHQTVSPNRQVFFFYSFKDTEKEFRGRYAIYDVETKEILAGGGMYFPKYPAYKDSLN